MARVLEPGRSFSVWGGYANCGNYPAALKASGLYFSRRVSPRRADPYGSSDHAPILCPEGRQSGSLSKYPYRPHDAK